MTDITESRMKQIGDRIRECRKAEKLTQGQIAAKITILMSSESSEDGVNQSAVSAWENGTQLPPLKRLIALSKIFRCDIGYLLCDYDNKKKDIADISEITGLSEAAVFRLSEMWSRIQREQRAGWVGSFDEKELKALNILLENDFSVLCNIHDYLFANYDSFSLQWGEKDDQEVFDKEVLLCNDGNSNVGTFVSINQMQSIFLLEIQKGLTELRRKIQRISLKGKKRGKGGF